MAFKNSPNLIIFCIFHLLLSKQILNVARFACKVEWDILVDFQTPWLEMEFFRFFKFHAIIFTVGWAMKGKWKVIEKGEKAFCSRLPWRLKIGTFYPCATFLLLLSSSSSREDSVGMISSYVSSSGSSFSAAERWVQLMHQGSWFPSSFPNVFLAKRGARFLVTTALLLPWKHKRKSKNLLVFR